MAILVCSIMFPVIIAALLTVGLIKSRRKTLELSADGFIISYKKWTKILSIVLLAIFYAVILGVMIARLVMGYFEPAAFWVVEAMCSFFCILGIASVLETVCLYWSVDGGAITVHRPVIKPRQVELSSVRYYRIVPSSLMGGLYCYDKHGIQLVHIENACVGLNRLTQTVTESGAEQLPVDFFQKNKTALKSDPVYSRHAKKTARRAGAIGFAICGAMFFLLTPIMTLIDTDIPPFENYEVVGVVRSIDSYRDKYSSKRDYTITLVDDGNEYFISSIIYDALDENMTIHLKVGAEVTLLLRDRDESGKKSVVGLVIDGVNYIDGERAYELYVENARFGMNMIYAFFGIGGAFMALSAVFFVLYAKAAKSEREQNKSVA